MEKQKPVVAYYYDEESGNYCYTVNHPWRPHRSKLVHNLVTGYNLEQEMIVHRPRARTFEEITEFHADGERCCCCACSRQYYVPCAQT
jgi:histone deacetylase 1/2